VKSTVVDRATIEKLLHELAEDETNPASEISQMEYDLDYENKELTYPTNSFAILNALDFPKFKFDPHRKMFALV